MTSLPDHNVLGEKSHPVPSSDKMALDLGINGSANHNELNHDTTRPESTLASKIDDSTPDVVASVTTVNGDHNANAFAVNNAVESSHSVGGAQTEDAPLVAEIVEETTTVPATVATEVAQPLQSTSDATSAVAPSVDITPLSAPDNQIELEATTIIPPVISATESDLRENPEPVTQEQAAAIQDAKPDRDLRDETETPNEPVPTAENEKPQPSSFDTSMGSIDQLPSSDPIKPASMSNLDLNTSIASPDVSAAPSAVEPAREDTEMADVPQASTKVSREREEDPEDEPSAKRTKLEDGEGAAPTEQPADQNGVSGQAPAPPPAVEDDGPLTPYQTKEIGKALRSAKSTKDGKNFKAAVIDMWPILKEGYLAKVENPIDLSIIEQKAKAGYSSMADYIKDVELLYQNCVTFNGLEHEVTRCAINVRDSLMSKLPSKEPPKVEKKKKATPVPSAARHVPERRQSRGAHTGGAGSPTTSGGAAQTFALDPSGTPLIRRDSTKAGDGGRPKREIHPPKSKDLVYNARPKKKKFATELKFCEEVLNELKKPKYQSINAPFLIPVDPVALGIPEYFKIVKSPMDLSTITDNLNSGHYANSKDFEADIRLMFKNCYKFNPPSTAVNVMGQELEAVFNSEWQRKGQYLADHAVSSAATPESSGESGDDESEEEEAEEDHNSGAANIIQARLVEEQKKLIEIMSAKKADQALIRMQQEMVAIVQKQVEEFAKRASQGSKKSKSKPAKKAAGGKKDTKAAKSKGYRPKNIGFAEKEQISNGIAQLEGRPMEQAIALLKKDLPDLDLENNPELDIDQFSNSTLSKLHDLIQRYAPHCIPAPEPRAPRAQKPTKPKKNKPMSKHEQEKKIDQLRQLEQQFKRHGSSEEAKVVPSVEQYMSSSGDESPSDSEED
ncbi:hypothetical protein V495_01691 [Pseudogymnoascus sp. VKM F-4514 (FW-929)]|nr:hypothetical protein V495_01691 [Pseudogymnoascus sp. VKM F-4514 (FW-929)]KFY63433.1 hypothetical protein V497_02007 [Pseudogymnoascus sp. VKM F-4516 (FW-969)]